MQECERHSVANDSALGLLEIIVVAIVACLFVCRFLFQLLNPLANLDANPQSNQERGLRCGSLKPQIVELGYCSGEFSQTLHTCLRGGGGRGVFAARNWVPMRRIRDLEVRLADNCLFLANFIGQCRSHCIFSFQFLGRKFSLVLRDFKRRVCLDAATRDIALSVHDLSDVMT